jgi:hypothetical protein
MMIAGFGMIPAWQFSMDPAVNPKINPNVVYPDGVYQTTTQPIGPWFDGSSGLSAARPRKSVQLLGLGDFSSIGGVVTGIGTFLILGLATFGGWTAYKRLRKH